MRLSTVSFVFLVSSLVSAQVKDETIDFGDFKPYADLKRCLKAVFTVDYPINDGKHVPVELGCTTNACLCRPDTLAEAIELGGSKAAEFCSNTNDQKSATSIFTAYCSEHGYTAVPALPTETPSGATVTVYADTTTAALATVTQTMTVSGASSFSLRPTLLGLGAALVAVFLSA